MSNQARDLGKGHWLPSVGIGYRFEFKPRMNVRLDFGVGKESTGFYFKWVRHFDVNAFGYF